MKGVAATEYLPASAIALWKRATSLVAAVPEHWEVRCHELARAVGKALELPVVDGQFGIVEHSWFVIGRYCILDPYQPGSLPLVQLHDISHPLPHLKSYKPGELPSHVAIDQEMVAKLVAVFEDLTRPESEWRCSYCDGNHSRSMGCF